MTVAEALTGGPTTAWHGAQSARPTVRHARLGEIDTASDHSLFVHPAYLSAFGYDDITTVARPGCATPAFFRRDRGTLIHLGRLDELSTADIDALSQAVFDATDAKAIVFEDINLTADDAPIRHPHRMFRYQANWRRRVTAGERILSSRKASSIRRQYRRLVERVGNDADVRFSVGRCEPGDLMAVVRLNKAKIEQSGHRHYFAQEKQQAMDRIATAIGYRSFLYAKEQLIGGMVMFVIGDKAYFSVVGYDLDYAMFGPGWQVYAAAFETLESMDCRDFNFLWGDSSFKASLKASREQLTSITVRRRRRPTLDRAYWKIYAGFAKSALKYRIKSFLKQRFPDRF